MKKLILASNSPRRKELLQQVNLTFTIQPSTIEETMVSNISPEKAVRHLARQKAQNVFAQFPDHVILAADTIVVFRGNILGKPADENEACKMLQMLSGEQHEVYTGVTILSEEADIVFHEETKVTFWDITTEEIDRYIASGEPFDKAGAYGIQGLGAMFVKEIQGDFFNVVGLPLSKTVRMLRTLGIHPDIKKE